MKMYGRVDTEIHIFLTLALVEGEWLASRPCCFTPRETAPSSHWIGGWVGASLDDREKLKFFTLPGLKAVPTALPRLHDIQGTIQN
jgi:hypothetical protein